MIVADSSVWVSVFRREDQVLAERLRNYIRQGSVILGDIILLELLQGARDHQHARVIEMELQELRILPMLSPALAVQAATHYRTLRSRGITIRKTADLIIGTYCIEHGHRLLQRDRDFLPMAQHLGLQLA
ncbi:type II toxin-antitoxin system VapC family toxin [Affinirhizobium pseudoryzae]|uniref:type II toxin-antitoxin system VapC family toxin n=1 Tax=Allorhizobium pseudoryzae TaxID=379684 RepID=UPI0013E9CFB3|nr:PIN domain nuclease [Allorhizobium pseudoryzae]